KTWGELKILARSKLQSSSNYLEFLYYSRSVSCAVHTKHSVVEERVLHSTYSVC
ncbi:hypothetical protein L9F63_022700, partial [Diploptera punctata]